MVASVKCVILLKLTLLFFCECKIYGFVTWSDGKAVGAVTDSSFSIPSTYIAKAIYSNKINSTGWAFLEICTSPNITNEKQAFAAGFLEGFLTRDLIWMHWRNLVEGYCYNKIDVCGLVEDYLDKNEDYIASMIKENPFDPYWYQVKLFYIQLEGLTVGYNEASTEPYHWLTVRDIMWLNMLGDLDELAFALSMPKETPSGLIFEHCSGLVKLLPDRSDLYTSQVTWNSYQSMLRFQKKYILHYKISSNSETMIPGYTMSFSSYPGFVQSTDDFYIISSGLVAAETTIGNSNRSLFEYINPIGQVLEFVRGMIACRLANSGEEWADIFRQYNSGTYNNQWYVLDYKKFEPRTGHCAGYVNSGLLWLVEQLPGYIEAADITQVLLENNYFPSYNIPFFPRVFNLSGGNERIAKFGDWFAYDTNPRAKIFKQKHGSINNLDDMFRLLRYNDYKYDPIARCTCSPPYSACNAISARNDLNPANGTYPFPALGHRSHGGIDVKATNVSLMKMYQFISVSGPTFNISRGIPPFEWSKFDMGPSISHIGHPNLWVFPTIVHRWKW